MISPRQIERQIEQTGPTDLYIIYRSVTGPLRPRRLRGMSRAENFRSRDLKHGRIQRRVSDICTKDKIKYVVFCLL